MTIALQPSRLFRHVLTAVLALLFMAWLHVAHADTAAPSPAQADFEKLQEQVRTLDKDNAVLAAKIEAQNNRIADLSLAATQHGNHIAAVSNQTTTLGNYIGIGGVFITVLLVVTGVFTYKNAKAEAKEAAKQEAQAWIDQHAAQLTQQVADLEAKVQKATEDIDRHIKTVAKASEDAQIKIQTFTGAAANSMLTPEKAVSDNTTDPEIAQQITRISKELKAKPENEFTSTDHFARGLALFDAENYEGALASFTAASSKPRLSANDAALYLNAKGVALGRLGRQSQAIAAYDELLQRFGADLSPDVCEQVAMTMFNRGIAIGKLHGPEKAIDAYDELVQRFGNDSNPNVRESVARASNGAAFSAMLLAKINWDLEPLRAQHLQRALAKLERLVDQTANKSVYLGNLGYCHFLMGNDDAARKWTLACLVAGGEAQLEAQRGDAKRYRVEPQDTVYEALLDELWQQEARKKSVEPVSVSTED